MLTLNKLTLIVLSIWIWCPINATKSFDKWWMNKKTKHTAVWEEFTLSNTSVRKVHEVNESSTHAECYLSTPSHTEPREQEKVRRKQFLYLPVSASLPQKICEIKQGWQCLSIDCQTSFFFYIVWYYVRSSLSPQCHFTFILMYLLRARIWGKSHQAYYTYQL